jgi:hypothetical protein
MYGNTRVVPLPGINLLCLLTCFILFAKKITGRGVVVAAIQSCVHVIFHSSEHGNRVEFILTMNKHSVLVSIRY